MLKRLFFVLVALLIFSAFGAECGKKIVKRRQFTRGMIMYPKGKNANKSKKAKKKTETENVRAALPGLPLEEVNWSRGPDKYWEVDFNKAAAKAKKRNKKLLLLITGSDWCGWCKKLKSDVLRTKEFKKAVNADFVPVYLDFPRGTILPDSQKAHNESVVRNLSVSGGYPNTVIIDPGTLKTIGKISGFLPAEKYVDELKALASLSK